MVSYRKASLLAAILLLVSFGVSAAELKIGVVNIERLFSESSLAREAQAKMEDEFAPKQREIIAMQSALEEKAAQLQKDMPTMSPDVAEAKQREFRNEERAFMRAQTEMREDVEIRQRELIGPVQQSISQEVSAYGKEQGFDLILFEGIAYASDQVDITAAVLSRLNSAE